MGDECSTNLEEAVGLLRRHWEPIMKERDVDQVRMKAFIEEIKYDLGVSKWLLDEAEFKGDLRNGRTPAPGRMEPTTCSIQNARYCKIFYGKRTWKCRLNRR